MFSESVDLRSELKLPAVRANVVSSLFELSSRDCQIEVWCQQRLNPFTGGYSDLQVVLEVFEDYDFSLPKRVGEVFYNQREQDLVVAVADNVDRLFEIYGDLSVSEMTDAQYIATPEWKELMSSAKTAYSALADEDKRRESQKT